MEFKDKTLEELIQANHKFGLVLYGKGIELQKSKSMYLNEICEVNSLNIQTIEDVMNKIILAEASPLHLPLEDLSILQLIDYLKQTHHEYIRIKLPAVRLYLFDLLKLDIINTEYKLLSEAFESFDTHLQEHISFEEEEVFPYVDALVEVANQKKVGPKFLLEYGNLNLKIIESKHKDDGDEFTELRKITQNFQIREDFRLLHHIVIKELQVLETDLETHAKIEEDYLFPQAEALERYCFKKIKLLSSFN